MPPAEPQRPSSCPYCGEHLPYSHGTYEHDLIDWIDGKAICRKILVRRYCCPKCGHTFSVLPYDLPSHGPYCGHFISEVLKEYATDSRTIEEICEIYQITPTTLYRWKKRYLPESRRKSGLQRSSGKSFPT